ncbi:Aste57867_21878 [Aphanomyces stellatus]|uniref:Aste57867_21878 protein n=1 Tax=Aphanomyces stellatus TaxID=120398 RepID=A0A485LJC8_9STRA|nr:hypothetical protein As57867_021809 [Aphanomyces stellatus]VFT98546.1 Aste57867_21878 [Aphanomyces stellatus]
MSYFEYLPAQQPVEEPEALFDESASFVIQAAHEGDAVTLKTLLRNETFANGTIHKDILMGLIFAAEEDHVDAIQVFHEETHPHAQLLEIAFLVACAKGYMSIVDYLVAQANVNVNVTVGALDAMREDPPSEWQAARAATKSYREDMRAELHDKGVQVAELPSMTGLFLASIFGNHVVVAFLLCQPNIQLNQTTWPSAVALVSALTNNHKDVALLLVDAPGVQINQTNQNGETALMAACSKNDTTVVPLLLASGANVNAVDAMGRTPLIHACERGAEAPALLLLEHPDVDVNAIDKVHIHRSRAMLTQSVLQMGRTALSIATYTDNVFLLKRLMAHRQIDVPPSDGMTKLMHACTNGDVGAIDAILAESKSMLNVTNFVDPHHLGFTAFMYACQAGHLATVARLLQEPSLQLNQRNKAFETGFVLACRIGSAEIVDILLQEPRLEEGQLAQSLFWASWNGFTHIAERLLFTPVDVNASIFIPGLDDMTRLKCVIRSSNRIGRTSLQMACRHGHKEVVALLLAHPDIDVNVTDPLGVTPLMTACMKKDKALAAMLLDHPSIKINQKDYVRPCSNRTALVVATQFGQIEIVKLLLQDEHIAANMADHIGNTPLMLACCKGNDTIVALLLQHPSVDPCAANDANETPLSIAISCEYDRVVKMLLTDKNKFVFMASCEFNNADNVAKLLYERSLDLNELNAESKSGLMLAAIAGSMDVVDVLLQDPAVNINLRNAQGDTAFIFACEYGNVDVVAQFLQHPELEFEYTKSSGLSAFLYACLEGQEQVVALLAESDMMDDVHLHNGFVAACARGHLKLVNYFLNFHDIDVNFGCVELFCFAEYTKAMCDELEWREWHDMVDQLRDNLVANFLALGVELPEVPAVTGLFLACIGRHANVVANLLEQPDIRVNSIKGTLGVPLVAAIANSDEETIDLLLGHPDVVVDEPNLKGDTPLILAAEKNQVDLVKRLLKAANVDVTAEDVTGSTALIRACAAGATAAVNLLLRCRDCNVNHVDKEGRSALSMATAAGDSDLLEDILSHPNMDVPDETGRTALMVACADGTNSVVEELLQRSQVALNAINFTDKSHMGYTALMYACEGGHVDIVNRLIAQPKLRAFYTTSENDSGLVVASRNGHTAVVVLLLSKPGADDDATLGHQALFWASRNGHVDVVNVLLSTSVDVNGFYDEPPEEGNRFSGLFRKGQTALQAACRHHHTSVVALLLAHADIDVNVKDDEGLTPLMNACSRAPDELIALLLRHTKLNVNMIGPVGDTALDIAVQSGRSSIVQLLVQHPAINVNIVDDAGNTPLVHACLMGDLKVMSALTQHPKIDLGIQNKAGSTVFTIASMMGKPELRQFLRAKQRELKKRRGGKDEHPKDSCAVM